MFQTLYIQSDKIPDHSEASVATAPPHSASTSATVEYEDSELGGV